MKPKKIMYCPPPKSYRKKAREEEHETDYHENYCSNSNGKIILGALAGLGIGALAGILLAPDKGKNTRANIAGSVSNLDQHVKDLYEAGRRKVEHMLEGMCTPNTGEEPAWVKNPDMETPSTVITTPGNATNTALGDRGVSGSNPGHQVP